MFIKKFKYVLNVITSRAVMQEIKNLNQAIIRVLRATSLEYTYPCILGGNVALSQIACRVLQLFHNIACGQKVSSFTTAHMLGRFWRPEFRNKSVCIKTPRFGKSLEDQKLKLAQ